ncbi:Mediator of DNA damage checkpoint protein 1 [Eufriesea mexicana]|uniref:PAX-interacting protein 1 n=1 Tax=Eufriesea mexicana TaxID=516756 RepID=A0A310SL38_9HYME|nr:Mediator of DNA damage checkpoint protein 1 [Eufriesea mexicana]
METYWNLVWCEQFTKPAGTPDSSLNNSSSLGENISVIPATQADEKESVFRCPTLPLRTSTSSARKSSIISSSIDISVDDLQSFDAEKKENVGPARIGINEMETQKLFESNNETNSDIHDVETQKMGLDKIEDLSKSSNKQEINIHDVVKQCITNAQGNITDIHDVETQPSTGIHDMITCKEINVQNISTRNNKRNLNAIFEDVNEERIEEHMQMSTQVLENVLQSPQYEDKLPDKNENSDTSTDNKTNSVSVTLSKCIFDDPSTPKPAPKNSSTPKSISKTLSTSKSVPADSSTPKSIPILDENLSIPKSVSKDPSTPKLKRKKYDRPKTGEVQEEIKIFEKDKNELDECSRDIDSQASNTLINEQLQRLTKVPENDDEDILAGLPEVRISGTLSNPASPTSSISSEYRININHNRRKQISVRIAPKKREASRKSSRKSLARKNVENTECPTAIKPNSLENNFDVDKESVRKEALIENEVAESAKGIDLNISRIGKRSLSVTDATENYPKKRKEDINEDATVDTNDRKKNTVANRRHSANTLNFIMKGNSSINTYGSSIKKSTDQEANLDKQAIIKVVRMSVGTPTGSISSSTSTELMIENNNSNKIRQSQSKTSIDSQVVTNISNNENKKTTKTVGTRGNANRKRINKFESHVDDISSQIGEESQEIEMIMNGMLTEENIDSNREKKKKVSKNTKSKNTKTKNTRGRRNTNTNTYTDVDNTESINESIKETKRNIKQSSRLIQSHQQSVTESSVEEETETDNQTVSGNTTNKTNNSRNKRQRQKTENVESNKKQKRDLVKKTISDSNSSIETASILSTPNRTRRSASQVEDPTKCTVLVTDKVRRTVKFLCALSLSVPIVSVDWLVDSERSGHFVELEDYILKDPAAEAKFRFKLAKSLEKAKKHKLLEGYTLVLTPNVAPPPLPELKSIIMSCGGKALLRPPSSWPQKAIIISREEDLGNANKFCARAPKTVTIQSTEFILTGILRQELEFKEFKLT